MSRTLSNVLVSGRRFVGRISNRREAARLSRRRARIEHILANPAPPEPLDDEEVFGRLQSSFPPRPQYGYGTAETWWRGVRRARWFMDRTDLKTPGAHIFEAACGDGMMGVALASYGHEVLLNDLEDWRERRARALPFAQEDLCASGPAHECSFDAVCSYNSFEHFSDPAAVLRALLRMCRPGGFVDLEFGPLYSSPWGLHAYRALRMPYPQFLFSEAFCERKVKELKLYDLGRERDDLQPLNRWRITQFEELWDNSGCERAHYQIRECLDGLDLIERYPSAFHGRGLEWADVVTEQVCVTLRKSGGTGSDAASLSPAAEVGAPNA